MDSESDWPRNETGYAFIPELESSHVNKLINWKFDGKRFVKI